MARKQAKRESAAGSNSRTDDQTRDEDIVMAGTSNQESKYGACSHLEVDHDLQLQLLG